MVICGFGWQRHYNKEGSSVHTNEPWYNILLLFLANNSILCITQWHAICHYLVNVYIFGRYTFMHAEYITYTGDDELGDESGMPQMKSKLIR